MIYATCKITLYKDKGRKTPFTSGYRPLFKFPNKSSFTSGKIELTGRTRFNPGDTDLVTVWFLEHLINVDILKAGTKFTFSEGPILIGEGEVLEIRKE
jgi:translation elongation factor EF-Tu-like GTPase